MSRLYLGAYWKNRKLTLREYADLTKAYLMTLMKLHPDFRTLEIPGAVPDSTIRIASDLSNLDESLMISANEKNVLYDSLDGSGRPTWEASSPLGFVTQFTNGKSRKEGGIGLIISAGHNSRHLSNAITITFSEMGAHKSNPGESLHHDFFKKVIVATIELWKPETALVSSHTFSDHLEPDGTTSVGWLTYIKNTNASAMRNNPDLIAAGIEMEPVSIGGTLFSIDRDMVSPDNEVQVARAKLLRIKLMDYKLIDN